MVKLLNNFFEVLGLVKKNPKNILLMIFFDLLFVISINILYRIMDVLVLNNDTQMNIGLAILYLFLYLDFR